MRTVEDLEGDPVDSHFEYGIVGEVLQVLLVRVRVADVAHQLS